MKTEIILFGLALQFLTRLPVSVGEGYTAERMATSVRYYPVVGAFIGALCAAVFVLASLLFDQMVAVLLSVAFGVMVTGALHEDGLADTADGIGGGRTKARALEIMRDSRLGTFGSVALLLAFALKVATLVALPAVLLWAILIAGHALSRCSAILVIVTSGYVREEGTGKPVAKGLLPGGTVFAVTTALIATLPLLLGGSFGAWTWGVVGLAIGHGSARLLFERKLGGYTGDTLGAVQQISEIGFYLGLAAWG